MSGSISPCYKCQRKDYAGGCSIGCAEREDALRKAAEEKRKSYGKDAARSLLIEGRRKAADKLNKRTGR